MKKPDLVRVCVRRSLIEGLSLARQPLLESDLLRACRFTSPIGRLLPVRRSLSVPDLI